MKEFLRSIAAFGQTNKPKTLADYKAESLKHFGKEQFTLLLKKHLQIPVVFL